MKARTKNQIKAKPASKRHFDLFLLYALPVMLTLFFMAFQLFPYLRGKVHQFSQLSFYSVVEESRGGINSGLRGKPLYKNQKISGEFVSTEDNLGIVLVRFFNFNRANSGEVSFKIKEKSAKKWHIKNKYNVDQFQPNEYFTFGFPIIADSRGKTYQFEITSIDGKKGDVISLSENKSPFAAVYNFSGHQLKSDIGVLARFICKKLLFAFSQINYIDTLTIYTILLALVLIVRKRGQISKQTSSKLVPAIKKVFYKSYPKAYVFIKTFYMRSSLIVAQLVLIKKYVFKHHQPKLYIFSIIFILAVALLMRISFFYNPNNLGLLFFYGIGGLGDYDHMIRHTMNYLINDNKTSLFWSLGNDFPFQVRLLAFFFSNFTFWKGLEIYSYLMILISSLVCLLPFVLLSRPKKFSFGGFIASLLLAINQLSVWLATGRTIDTLTTFFFSLFIVFFILALRRKNYFIAVSLGLIGFLDGFNRGMMIFNDWPALFLFGILYSVRKIKVIKKFPYIHFDIIDLKYSFSPFFIYSLLYIVWNIFYFILFERLWSFSPLALATEYNPVKDDIGVLGTIPLAKLANYCFLLIVTISKMPQIYLAIPILIGLIILSFFIYSRKERKEVFVSMLIVSMVIFCLFFLSRSFNYFIDADILDRKSLSSSVKYFLDLKEANFFQIFIFLQVIFVHIILLKREAIKYLIIIVSYILVLGYGIYISFSERHFIQVIIILSVLLGATLDVILSRLSLKKNLLLNGITFIGIISLLFYILCLIFISFFNILNKQLYFLQEKKYLHSVESIVPSSGVLLLGGERENPIFIVENTKKDTIYNVNNTEPILIPYNGKRFLIPFSDNRIPPYNVNMSSSKDIKLLSILNNPKELKKHNFYMLDYDFQKWNKLLGDKISSLPFKLKKKYILKKIEMNASKRAVYKLELLK
jgi:hypothetical protein